MKLTRLARTQVLLAMTLLAASSLARAAVISNQASGTVGSSPLNVARAQVNLARIDRVATSATAEIVPNGVTVNTLAVPFTYDVLPEIGPGDSGVSRIDVTVPAGYTNVVPTAVSVGGTALVSSCPTPGANQYCATVSGGVLSVVLGTKLTTTADIRISFTADAPATAGIADFTSSLSDGALTLATVAGNADGDAADANSIQVEAGVLLQIRKTANKEGALVGEVVTYSVEISNPNSQSVTQVTIDDSIPPNFKYLPGSARLDGAPIAEPTGSRPLVFNVGTVSGSVDQNSNGTIDAAEQAHRLLTYQLVIGSGAKPGPYTNTAVAQNCPTCVISNQASATVEVRLDPVFDLGTIVGKVFEDRNRNGLQDPGETGVPNAFVALDDGTYALTDEFGRYHFPAVKPGHRMVKIDLRRLAPGATATTDESVVLWVTPGLMLTADFGVCLLADIESIGAPDEPALAVRSEHSNPPIEVQGSAEALSALVNGSKLTLPSSDVRLEVAEITENIRLRGTSFEKPARFDLSADRSGEIADWSLTIHGGGDVVVKKFEGKGAPPASVSWDGRRDDGKTVAGGETYAYQLEVRYQDGSDSLSARRLVGIDHTSITALNLAGDAFETGKSILSSKAKKILDETAVALRERPNEKIVIEGHTDWVGTNAYNMELSKARAKAALDYLVRVQKLPASQFVLAWYGEERPIAPNDTPEGRMLNRRVVIQGQMQNGERSRVLDQYRTLPEVRVNGAAVAVGDRGRFFAPVEGDPKQVEIALTDPSGRSSRTTISVPSLAVLSPTGEILLPYGGSLGGCKADNPPAGSTFGSDRPAVVCRVQGRTDPGNQVELDGKPVAVEADGTFAAELPLHLGDNATAIVARSGEGVARFAEVVVKVADRDGEGRLFVTSAGVPTLTLQLPPKGVQLPDPRLDLSGTAEPGSTLTINGQPVTVQGDGTFRTMVELPVGPSRLVAKVTDPQGRSGSIERDVDVAKNQIFLLAFAEGTFGQLRGKGYLEGAGMDQPDEYYSNGRVAYYLKGTIAGKYLITSAFDSGKDSKDSIFGDLNAGETQKLLTNLDPDKFYPVYGDASTVVFDAESRGKFYLALDGPTMHAVVGNYPLSLDQTELAAYRRTLYGARFAYESVSHSSYGDPDTQVVLFGAELEQEHVHDELQATGGALYYLSRRDVLQGSEQITLVVRDKLTGLQLSATRQNPNIDYVIKYEEGRVMFERPLSSVVPGGSLVDLSPLSGNPVSILVDYEARASGLDKTAAGGRFRQQIGDHVAVGGTYVTDEPASGSYELQGADAEVRFGKNSRITAEVAQSTGADSVTNLSTDGGLTYDEVTNTTGLGQEGSAWKAAADLDVGEWFGAPNRYHVRAYFKELDAGFFSSGNFREHSGIDTTTGQTVLEGSRKMGVDAVLDVTQADTVHARYDRDEQAAGDATTSSLSWAHTKLRWGFAVEFLDTQMTGGTLPDRSFGAAHFWSKLGEKVTARFEHQQTLSGPDNDQTTAGIEIQALPNLALEVQATDGSLGHSAQAGAIYTMGESRVYLMEKLTDDQVGERTSTVLGAKSPIGKDTKVYTEYQWENADTGGRTLSLVGLQRQWTPTPGLRVLLSGENADVKDASGDTTRTALSGGLTYANGKNLTASTRQEMRWEHGTADKRQYFTVNQLDYKLNEDLTALARLRYSKTENDSTNTTDARLDEKVLGLAYRPIAHQRFNALFKYTSLLDDRPLNTQAALHSSRKMDVFALDTSFRISPRFEWLAKEAARIMDEQVESMPSARTNTYLVIQRLNFRIWKPIGVGVEYRVLGQREADDTRQGWLTEAMWDFMKNFSAGVGYNFTDFSDNVFSQNDYQVQGWYFRVQAKY